ncbi:MAG: type II secretion system protein [Candidatus Saganbacteria bacterium]|nr:type II secretion system protein [Candidatus Saganbacteria bacterium]
MTGPVKRGFTLVEVVISMVVIAIVMYASLSIFINSGARESNVEVFTVAQTLAEDKMEETMAKEFTAISDEAASALGGDLGDFSSSVSVAYVTPEALDTAVTGPTNYKRINVRIEHALLGRPASLECIKVSL